MGEEGPRFIICSLPAEERVFVSARHGMQERRGRTSRRAGDGRAAGEEDHQHMEIGGAAVSRRIAC